jgi:hypothetical protein
MKLLTNNELMICSGGASYITTTERVNVEGISEPCVQAIYKLGLQSMQSTVSEYKMEQVLMSNCTMQDAFLIVERAENPILLSITLS